MVTYQYSRFPNELLFYCLQSVALTMIIRRTQESNTTPEGVFRYKANLFPTFQCESADLPTNLQVPVAARAYLSCPGKKGSKEAGWGGFELCAPAHKSLSKGKTATGSLNISRFAALCHTLPDSPPARIFVSAPCASAFYGCIY